jgi:hypothetical protein
MKHKNIKAKNRSKNNKTNQKIETEMKRQIQKHKTIQKAEIKTQI